MFVADVVELCRTAGAAILEVYAAGSDVEWKADGTPITDADRAAHRVLVAGLEALTPDLPIVSEEDAPSDGTAAHGAARHWLVDPLDGTKEFVKRTGEFTVNVALIADGVPVLGVVQAPVTGTVWTGLQIDGRRVAERIAADGSRRPLVCAPIDPDRMRVAASRSHGGRLVEAIEAGAVPGASVVRAGSSLKFCLVAEGAADLYLRDGPTMPWDTAAAHAVLEGAGGTVRTLDGVPLTYPDPHCRNPPFLAIADPTFDPSGFLDRAHPG